MRYAAARYGEYATALGEFSTGRTVEVIVRDLPWTAGTRSILSNGCGEVDATGVFQWSTDQLSVQPIDYSELLYIMTDVTPVVGTGRTHKGKLIIGGYPSDSAVRRFEGAIHIDSILGAAGQIYPQGTRAFPIDNIADARAVANRESIYAYRVRNPITLTNAVGDHLNWKIDGTQPQSDIVTVEPGVDITGTAFERTGLLGTLDGSITAKECLVGNSLSTVAEIAGTFTSCGFDGIIQPAPARMQGLELSSTSSNILVPGCILDYRNQLCIVLGELKGIWAVRNTNPANPATTLAFALAGADLTLESSVTGPNNIILLGNGELHDSKTGSWPAGTFTDNIIRGSQVQRTTHINAGTILIDRSVDPWQVVHYQDEAGGGEVQRYDLYDGDGNAINNANPLTDYVGVRLRA